MSKPLFVADPLQETDSERLNWCPDRIKAELHMHPRLFNISYFVHLIKSLGQQCRQHGRNLVGIRYKRFHTNFAVLGK